MKIWEVWRTPYKGARAYSVVASGSPESTMLRDVWADWNGQDVAALVDICVLPDGERPLRLALEQKRQDDEDAHLGIPLRGIPLNVDPSELDVSGYM